MREAPARVRRGRVLRLDAEHRHGQQATDLVLGAQQPLTLLGVERRQHRGGVLVRDAIQAAQLGPAGARKRQPLGAPVGRVGAGLHKAVPPQSPDHPRQVARVEPQPRAQVARRRPVEADLEQHPVLAEGAAPEVAVPDHARLPCHEPVEAAHASDL